MVGIVPDQMPTSSDDTTAYAALLTQRKELESQRRSDRSLTNERQPESVCMPGPFDVISGRGRSLMSHQGNKVLRNLVEEHLGAYQEASRQDKKVVSSQVVKLIKKKGRFLKEHLHGWVEIDEVASRLKVSHAFRDFRASSKKGEAAAQRVSNMMDIFQNDDIGSFDLGSNSDMEDGNNNHYL